MNFYTIMDTNFSDYKEKANLECNIWIDLQKIHHIQQLSADAAALLVTINHMFKGNRENSSCFFQN